MVCKFLRSKSTTGGFEKREGGRERERERERDGVGGREEGRGERGREGLFPLLSLQCNDINQVTESILLLNIINM